MKVLTDLQLDMGGAQTDLIYRAVFLMCFVVRR